VSAPVIHAGFADATALPRVVRLRPGLTGLAFPLMKLLPAPFIVRRAFEREFRRRPRRPGIPRTGELLVQGPGCPPAPPKQSTHPFT
jgi:hypothetical protein